MVRNALDEAAESKQEFRNLMTRKYGKTFSNKLYMLQIWDHDRAAAEYAQQESKRGEK